MASQSIPISPGTLEREWQLPDRGLVGIAALILTESSLLLIFVVAYLYYIGKSLSGPYPKDVLELPIFSTVCLLSSSLTIVLAERALEKLELARFKLWWAVTIALAIEFLTATGVEWSHLIRDEHLTIATNLFGTTYYSLVGLHATHVVLGLVFQLITLIATLVGFPIHTQLRRVVMLSWYWHFVDAVWVVVFAVVYIIGR